MTAGERLIQQGIQQGLEQGIQQGLEQGILQGERAVLLRQLRRRFGAEVDAGIEQRLAAGSVEQLEAWAERVLSAATLADLFAE